MSDPPTVFISYSHDDDSHKDWVRGLAIYLRNNGINAILDQWDLELGSDLAKFMEQGLSRSNRVLVISTDKYIVKADNGTGGVGYEKMIVTADLLSTQDTTKFIPVVRNANGVKKLPVFLSSRLYIDLSQGNGSEEQRHKLLRELHNAREASPPIGVNPFAIHAEEIESESAGPSESAELSREGIESTVFFSDRFSSAFPGVSNIAWFEGQNDISMRLNKLLEAPLYSEKSSPIWWWRGGNLHIHSFKYLGDGLYLMDRYEHRINKIAAVNSGDYYQKFVYVETEAMEPTGLYPDYANETELWIDGNGYVSEEYGLFRGAHKVNRAEYDDNATVIDGQLIELGENVELRVRYTTPYNFLIAANQSPINNNQFDRKLENLMNSILHGAGSLEVLAEKIMRLPKKNRR